MGVTTSPKKAPYPDEDGRPPGQRPHRKEESDEPATAAPARNDDRLLTLTEVAELTRLPVATLRYKRSDKTGPRSFRLGRRVMFWLSDVLAWIEQHYNDDGPRAA